MKNYRCSLTHDKKDESVSIGADDPLKAASRFVLKIEALTRRVFPEFTFVTVRHGRSEWSVCVIREKRLVVTETVKFASDLTGEEMGRSL